LLPAQNAESLELGLKLPAPPTQNTAPVIIHTFTQWMVELEQFLRTMSGDAVLAGTVGVAD
jgi:hypothetical protein